VANDTIIASATPPGIGGLSVLRLSGPIALESLSSVSKKSADSFPPRVATLSPIFNNSGAIIDTCIVTFFPEPASYTAEDVIEISCHGSPIIVSSILSAFLNYGLRLADPGEFTKRSFLNGKLALVQAESVAQLISSKSVRAAELTGRQKKPYSSIQRHGQILMK
jgi:tRNA modification GTPase